MQRAVGSRHLTSVVWPAQVLEALQAGAGHDALVCCAGYILGEYGRLVASEVPTHVQFALLQERFLTVTNETKVCGWCSFCPVLGGIVGLLCLLAMLAISWLAFTIQCPCRVCS